MRVSYKSLFLILLTSVACGAQQEEAGCRSYEPALSSLHGKLVRKTFPGPPNYEDIRKGNQPETYWLLKLESPICVDKDPAQSDLNPAQKDVSLVQLVLRPQDEKRAAALSGKSVVANGTLFGAHTGHHHTAILLSVTYLELAHWK